MPISTTCPSCKALFRLAEELAGRKVKCQKCHGLFVVPRPDAETVEPGARVPDARDSGEAAAAQSSSAPNVPFVPPPLSPGDPVDKPETAPQDDGRNRKPAKIDPDERPRRRGRGPRMDELERPRSKALPIVLALVGAGVFACVAVIGVAVVSELMRDDRRQQEQVRANVRRNQVIIQRDAAGNPVKRGGFHAGPVRPVNDTPTTEIELDANGVFRLQTELKKEDPLNPDKKRHKHFAIRLEEGKRYQIDMMAEPNFDAYLYLLDDKNVIVDQNDDIQEGVVQDSRIIYACPRTATYKIEATFFDNSGMGDGRQSGAFTLVIRELK